MQKWKNEWICQRIYTNNGRIQIGWVANVFLFLHPQYFKGQFLNLPPFIRIDRLVRLALRNSQICICSYSWGHILSPAVSIWRSLHEKANSRTPLWNICLYSCLPTYFFLLCLFSIHVLEIPILQPFFNTIGHHTIKLSLWEQVILDNQLEILQICLVMNKISFLIMIKLVMTKGMVKRWVDTGDMEKKFSILNWWDLCFAYWLSRHNKDTLPRILKDNTFNSVWVKVSKLKWVISAIRGITILTYVQLIVAKPYSHPCTVLPRIYELACPGQCTTHPNM